MDALMNKASLRAANRARDGVIPVARCLNNAATITATIIQDLRANFGSCNYSDLQNSFERDKCPIEGYQYTERT
jgi:hypothetical protein